jgi:wobble nucleotide-excising tRNase
MKTLSEIAEAIKELPTVEARQLAGWLNEYLDDAWERQIQTDLATGKLDKFIAKVESDIKANQVKDLDRANAHTY